MIHVPATGSFPSAHAESLGYDYIGFYDSPALEPDVWLTIADALRSTERITVGTLEISAPEPDRETGGEIVVFDPTRVIDGIELSDDPILRVRPLAYSVSVDRRV